ncbi:MAG: betC 3 [Nocardioides sp.]|nr:betC 3 [Nocardioides sp.]
MGGTRRLAAALTLILAGTLVGTEPLAAPSRAAYDVAVTSTDPAERAAGPRVRNAVVFLVDDMSDFRCSQARDFLPQSSAWLRDRGTCYENATTATPVCCPARAQVQTGQLAHNNGVRTQFEARRLDPRDTVQHDLSRAGLQTYGVGKNLNGVTADAYYGRRAVDTGFDDFDFWNSYRGRPGSFLLYDEDGDPYKPRDGLYSTETNGAFVDRALDEHLASGERFFVHDSFFAPHKQFVGTGRDVFPVATPQHRNARVPRFRYAREAQVRDKLPLFRQPRRSRDYYQRLWTARIRALYDVDHQMARVFRRLEAAGVLDETAVIFTSDNGYTDRGQVNWDGKALPYPASTDIPMLAFYPGARRAVVTKGVQLIDVAPTLYDVLGVEPGHRLDGHSLVGPHQRRHVYGEFYAERNRAALAESGRESGQVPSWRLLKRGRWSYVEWYGGRGRSVRARELYGDPGMLDNVLWKGHRGKRPPVSLVRSLHRDLKRFSRCAGTAAQGSNRPCP